MTRNQRILLSVACGLAAVLFGCSDSNPAGAKNVVPAFIDIVSGQHQSDTVGKELPQPLVARVRNSDDQPLAGQIVNFRVIKGGGSVFAGAAITNAEGLAQERWTLGTSVADSQVVEARAVDPSSGAALVFARFFATPVAGAPDSLEKISGDGQSALAGAALPESLVVRVADSYGNDVPGASVSWTAAAGTGTFNPVSGATTANGRASTKWTLGAEVGSQSAKAVVGTVPAVTFTANSFSPSALVVTKSAGDNQSASPGTAVAIRPAVLVTNANGNPISGVTVTFAVAQGGGSVTGATVSTDATGTASVGSWVLGSQVGTNALSANVANGPAVTFAATAVRSSPDITVSIVNPSGGLVGDTVHVSANVTSRLQVASVGVAVAGRTATLSNPTPGVWTGTVLLNGAPRDTMTLVATATDVNGSVGQAFVALTHDLPPRVTMTSPINNSAVSGTVTIDASCADDDPNGCNVSAEITFNGVDKRYAGPSPSPLHASLSLAGWEGQKVRVVAYATDSKGQTTCCASDTVWVESSHLHFMGVAEGIVLDASDSRLLWRSRSFSPTVGIHDVNTGVTDTAVASLPYGTGVGSAFLTPTGAAFVADRLYVWANGSLTTRTVQPGSIAASGNYVIYHTPSLYRFDVTTGADILIASDDGNTNNDVAANGDVAYWNQGYAIVRYRNGTKTVVASRDSAPGAYTYPLTDGMNIVFQHAASLPTMNHEVWLFDGSSSSLSMLSPPAPHDAYPYRNYAVNGGWTAFTKEDASGNWHVWTRSPAAVLREVSPGGNPSSLEAIGSDGSIVFANNGDRYLAGPTSSPVRIGPATSSQTNVSPVFWRNGTFVVLLENGAFTLTP